MLVYGFPVLLAFWYWYTVATPWYCSSFACCVASSACPEVKARGYVDPRYQDVVDLLEESLTLGWDLGAFLYVEVDGKPVIDVVGGFADPRRQTLLKSNMANLIMSNGKSMENIGIALLVERGLVDLEAPIAKYWPEFAQQGKAAVTMQDILSHRAGSCSFQVQPVVEILRDDTKRDEFLASQPFLYPRGTVAYRGWTSSFYSDALVRRVDPKGRNLQQLVQEEVFAPLGETLACPPNLDNLQVNQVYGISIPSLLLGILPQAFLPRSFFKFMDVRMIVTDEQIEILETVLKNKDPNYPGTKPTIPVAPQKADDFNNRDGFLSFPMMSANCMANAKGATRALASFFESDKLVSKETRDKFLRPLPEARDTLLMTKYNHTSSGWAINLFQRRETEGCVGWFGMGGSSIQYCTVGSHTVSFGYVPNVFSPKVFVDRATMLISAVAKATEVV